MKKMFSFLLLLKFIIFTPVMAQDNPAADVLKNTQADILIVAGAGVGGAILGLSTLSFMDRPSKHVSNIWTGAALGVIAGVIVVAYNSAQKGSEELQNDEASLDFNTHERVAWHFENEKNLTNQKVQFGTQIWKLSF